jgi:hypothetical protein
MNRDARGGGSSIYLWHGSAPCRCFSPIITTIIIIIIIIAIHPSIHRAEPGVWASLGEENGGGTATHASIRTFLPLLHRVVGMRRVVLTAPRCI